MAATTIVNPVMAVATSIAISMASSLTVSTRKQDLSCSLTGVEFGLMVRSFICQGGKDLTYLGHKNWQSNIILLGFKIYSLKLQNSHLFSDDC